MDLTDKFLISNTGKLYSKSSNKVLKTCINKQGYESVCVSIGGRNKKKSIKIHIAVACMFCDGYRENLTVNHKNGDKLNNNSYNLEWVTMQENVRHAYDNIEICMKRKKPVKQIDIVTGRVIRLFSSTREAERFCTNKESGSTGTIKEVLHGMGKTAYGYRWEYC